MDSLLAKVFPDGRKSYALRLSAHLDNCRVHSSNASKYFADENFLVAVPRLPYSPDLPPSDFWLFGQIKTPLADHVFNDIDELLEAVMEF
jgi:hypothetical protein